MASVSDVKDGLPTRGGFQFDNVQRNALLERLGMHAPKATKTGTTIAGIVFRDGVMLGADTRATEGPIVADKNCAKIHYIADNIYCCGAGTAAGTAFAPPPHTHVASLG
jgi:20S proteasome subunit beta 2